MRPLSQEKIAYLRGALTRAASFAERSPADALVLTHALDEATRGAARGALAGGLGGLVIAPEGDEIDTALKGALVGGLANAVRRGHLGGTKATSYIENIENLPTATERRQARQHLMDLQDVGKRLRGVLA